MSISEVWVLVGGLVLTGLMAWYFFGPKKSRRAELDDGVQVIEVTVKGGYSPDVIQVVPGVPVRMLFDRQESGDCSSRVVFPEFHVNQTLPAFATTPVEFLPEEPGEYEFACGMNMIRGRLQVLESGARAAEDNARPAAAVASSPEGVEHVHGSAIDAQSAQGASDPAPRQVGSIDPVDDEERDGTRRSPTLRGESSSGRYSPPRSSSPSCSRSSSA